MNMSRSCEILFRNNKEHLLIFKNEPLNIVKLAEGHHGKIQKRNLKGYLIKIYRFRKYQKYMLY